MEYMSYDKCTEKSITEVKMYILLLMDAEKFQDVHDIINGSIDIKQLQRKIRKRSDIVFQIFDKIKLKIDRSTDVYEIEYHVLFMNLLLCPTFVPLVKYKYNLFERVLSNGEFTVQTYCILRHLLSINKRELTDFVMYMCQISNKTPQEYHYLAIEILCIEHQFDNAYAHLEHVLCDEHIEKYKAVLYHYNPHKFKKATQRGSKSLWQVSLFRKARVWENDYFTY